MVNIFKVLKEKIAKRLWRCISLKIFFIFEKDINIFLGRQKLREWCPADPHGYIPKEVFWDEGNKHR